MEDEHAQPEHSRRGEVSAVYIVAAVFGLILGVVLLMVSGVLQAGAPVEQSLALMDKMIELLTGC